MKRRAQFNQFLSASPSLTAHRYFPLMALATIELLFNTPISYGLYLNITQSPIQPWISWDNTHFDFGGIEQMPAVLWRSSQQTVIAVELNRWAQVFCALVFFAFFGFAAEASKHYRLSFWAVARRFGCAPPPDGSLPFKFRLPWVRTTSSPSSSTNLYGVKPLHLSSNASKSIPRTPVKQRPKSLIASLADTNTDYDHRPGADMEKGFILPSPSPSTGPPQYAHDIELGAYRSPSSSHASGSPRSFSAGSPRSERSPSPTSSDRSHRTLDNARPRTHVADAFFPAAALARPMPPSPRSPRPSTWPALDDSSTSSTSPFSTSPSTTDRTTRNAS
ncbi:pheromone A receptor-domain-containing protein [Mycena crocata]|nr:pheromone A receptor-domain-containing protein [Mycena crocata]